MKRKEVSPLIKVLWLAATCLFVLVLVIGASDISSLKEFSELFFFAFICLVIGYIFINIDWEKVRKKQDK